jgi:hypothetical protein
MVHGGLQFEVLKLLYNDDYTTLYTSLSGDISDNPLLWMTFIGPNIDTPDNNKVKETLTNERYSVGNDLYRPLPTFSLIPR